jgi:ABC-type lipoprotein export system ATPase subunit
MNLVLVTHNLESSTYADRIIHLHQGKLEDAQS